MPIVRLLRSEAFEPEHCQAMGTAFDGVLAELGLIRRDDALCERIAMKIIQLGHEGVRDSERLRELTLATIHDAS